MSAITKVARVACTLWIPLAALALTVTATTWPRPHARTQDRIVAARLTDVPSHNRRYRATLDLTSDSVWTLRVGSPEGVTIRNAAVAMDVRMPEQGGVVHDTLVTTEDSRTDSYRVRPVPLDRPGWWNINVRIVAAGQTDSLAFNVILK